MPRRRASSEQPRVRRRGSARGVVEFLPEPAIRRSRRRWVRTAVGLGLLAAFWTLSLTGGNEGDSTMTGFLMLEAFTVAPLAYSLFRVTQLSRLLRRADDDLEAQSEQVSLMRERHDSVEEALHGVERIVGRLPEGIRCDAGREALGAATRTAARWHDLLHHVADLTALRRVSKGSAASAALDVRIQSAEADVRMLEGAVDDLALSLATLADASDDDDLELIDREVAAAAERMRLLAEALVELRELPSVPEADEQGRQVSGEPA